MFSTVNVDLSTVNRECNVLVLVECVKYLALFGMFGVILIIMEHKLPEIFNYLDVKKYLADYREMRKTFDPGFSNVFICFSLGQTKSKGYFNNVISGRVKIGSSMIDRFIPLLELKGEKAKYFRALVNFCQTIDKEEKEFYFDQLVKYNKIPSKEMDLSFYNYYKSWLNAVVRSLLDIYDFKNDYKDLASKLLFPVTPGQIKKSIETLLALDLIKRDDKGYLRPAEKAITAGKELKEHLLRQYQAKCLEHSSEVVLNSEVKPQKVTTMTVSVSEKAYDEIKSKIDQFKTEIRSIVHNDSLDAERLCQINIHLFPQTN